MQFRRFGQPSVRQIRSFCGVESRNYTADQQLTLEGQTTTEGQIKFWRIRGEVGVLFIMKDRIANRHGVY
jgi:hypothetical protein